MVLPQISQRGLVDQRSGSEQKEAARKAIHTDLQQLRKPNRRPNKLNNGKASRHDQGCKRCLYELRAEEPEMVYLPAICTGPMTLAEQVEKEDTFTRVIEGLTNANRVPTRYSWNSNCSDSASSTPRLPSVRTSACSVASFNSSDSNYSTAFTGQNNRSSNNVTITSEVPPAPNVIHIPLDRLLDYGDSARKVTLMCSKYDEIGNPQARKKKNLKRGKSAKKKWNRMTSYANGSSIKAYNRKEKLNFMDKQINSIYNSYEKAKIDHQLSPRPVKKETLVPKSILPKLEGVGASTECKDGFRKLNKSVERFVLNTMLRAHKAARFECKIPTIPISLAAKTKHTRMPLIVMAK